MTTSTYKPTGYPRGRPRKGELRPISPQAEACAEWRAKNYDHWLEKNREYQANWRAKNLERSREISRGTRIRKKKWDADHVRNEFVEKASWEFAGL